MMGSWLEGICPTLTCLSQIAQYLCWEAGIGIAAIADTQLHNFVTTNERRRGAGKPPVLLLDTGTKASLALRRLD